MELAEARKVSRQQAAINGVAKLTLFGFSNACYYCPVTGLTIVTRLTWRFAGAKSPYSSSQNDSWIDF